MQCQNHFLHQLMLQPLLLQAHAVAEAVVAKVVVECSFAAASEDGENVRTLRECKEVDLVFGADDVAARRGVGR
jgi:hypothetical protein